MKNSIDAGLTQRRSGGVRMQKHVSRGHRSWVVLVVGLAPLVCVPLAGAATPGMRDVVLVGNAASGTVSFLDGHTWQNLGSINVTPEPISPAQEPFYDEFNQQEGGVRAVDDAIASPDGTTLYVSRANRGDVAAFDLVSHQLLGKT